MSGQEKPILLMLGDSLVEWGDWEKLLSDFQVVNCGIAGEHVEELSARLNSEIESAPEPDHILLMAGTNNLLMGNHFFPAIFRSLLPRLAALCPDSSITLTSIMPMSLPGLNQDYINTINQELLTVTRESNCLFLDMSLPFIEQCLPITRPCFLTDGVHLSTVGYQIWAKEIRHHIAENAA